MKNITSHPTQDEPDLNQLIPEFMNADADRRRKVLALLNGEDDLDKTKDTNTEQRTKWLNQKQLAEQLGIHPNSIRRWQIPCRKFGRLPRYNLAEAIAYLGSEAFQKRHEQLKLERANERPR